MSEMTNSSSSDLVNRRRAQAIAPGFNGHHQASTQQQVKTLTNFSIDSIMGDHNHQHQQGHHAVSPSLKHQHHKHTSLVAVASTKPTIPKLDSPAKMIKGEPYSTGDRHNQSQIKTSPKKASQEIRKYRPKNFQCPACGMAFSNNGQLKNHVRIHTGERPFRCNQSNCGKTFTRNEELTRHKLIHTGVRPHACPSCSKRFGRKDHLKKHVRTHDRKRLRKGGYVSQTEVETCSRLTKQGYTTDEVSNDKSLLLLSLKNDGHVSKRDDVTKNVRLNEHPLMTQISSGLMQITPTIAAGAQYNQFPNSAPFLPLPPVTFAPTPQFLDTSTARTMAAIASSTSLNSMLSATRTSSEPLQQLAGDYWQKWYNFLGFYQQS